MARYYKSYNVRNLIRELRSNCGIVGFHLYDINHDGSIEKNELKLMLMKIGAMRGYPKAHTPLTTTSKIDDFIAKVHLYVNTNN